MNRPSRIVVVDDEAADMLFISKAFERGAHEHQVTGFSNGTDLLAFLDEVEPDQLPDVLLLDMNLPEMTGFDILAAIRASEKFGRLIVIVFTSSAYRKEIFDAYGAGANAFVTKPARLADLDQLVASIEDFWFTAAQPPYS